MNKNISVWRGNNTPPTKYHLWLKNNGRLYVNIDEKWQDIDKDSDPQITKILNQHTTKLNNHQIALDNIFNSSLNNIAQDNLFNSSFDAKNINMKNSSTYVFTKIKDENSSISQNIKFPLATGQIRQLINPNGVSIKASQIISSSSSKQYYIDAGVIIIE